MSLDGIFDIRVETPKHGDRFLRLTVHNNDTANLDLDRQGVIDLIAELQGGLAEWDALPPHVPEPRPPRPPRPPEEEQTIQEWFTRLSSMSWCRSEYTGAWTEKPVVGGAKAFLTNPENEDKEKP
jgi:hypothetical protein